MADADEQAFRRWYAEVSRQYGLNANPDAPDQFYDYRAAFRAGSKPDRSGHWPSAFKKAGHPNEVVGGFNTRTGERVPGTKQATESELVQLGWDADTAERLSGSVMADDMAEVVIVGNDGAEHVFPPGFDPKKAAAIVKQQAKGPQFGDPSLHPTIGTITDSPTEPTWKDELGALLKHYAHPESLSDIGHLLMVPGVDATRGLSTVVPGVANAVGKGATSTGLALEKAGQSGMAKIAGGAGLATELMRGDVTGAMVSAAAPHAITATGKGMQLIGRVMQGLPNSEGMVSELYQAATNPGSKVALNQWEQKFLDSVAMQVQAGNALTAGQKLIVNKIYTRVFKP